VRTTTVSRGSIRLAWRHKKPQLL